MNISLHALDIIGVTPIEFIEWCNENNKPVYKNSTKIDFFKKVKEGRIVRDKKTGKLVNKRIKEDN